MTIDVVGVVDMDQGHEHKGDANQQHDSGQRETALLHILEVGRRRGAAVRPVGYRGRC